MKMNKERAEELLGVINRGAAIPSLQWLKRCKEALEYVIEHEQPFSLSKDYGETMRNKLKNAKTLGRKGF